MFLRKITPYFERVLTQFPAVVLTGARQTGKSTLCRHLLQKTHRYLSLEDPDVRGRVLEDPRGFLELNPPPLILDEIQYAPDLVNYLQGKIDNNRAQLGQYILTGSQNFLLMDQVTQSLAGRAALVDMYPCSVEEVDGEGVSQRSALQSVAEWILRGGFPELAARPDLEQREWCANYIRLYLERDVRRLVNVSDLNDFERFLRLVAIRTGQILSIADLARDSGVAPTTVTRWLNLMQVSYQIYRLPPYFTNLSKRLIKSPKIYFCDTALAAYLMGLHTVESLLNSPQFGALFETACVLEHVKWNSFSGGHSRLHYFRTKEGLEADLVIEEGERLHLREIKSIKTCLPHHAVPLEKISQLLEKTGKVISKTILMPTEEVFKLKQDVDVSPWHWVKW